MPQTLIEELRKGAQETSGNQPDKLRRRKLHGKAVTSLLAPSLAKIHQYLSEFKPVSYTHLTLPTIYSV